MSEAKPVRYNFSIRQAPFDNDETGFESSTPFIPPRVGEYIDRNWSLLGDKLEPGQAFQVTAVKHGFQDLGSHISQYVDVCVQVVTIN